MPGPHHHSPLLATLVVRACVGKDPTSAYCGWSRVWVPLGNDAARSYDAGSLIQTHTLQLQRLLLASLAPLPLFSTRIRTPPRTSHTFKTIAVMLGFPIRTFATLVESFQAERGALVHVSVTYLVTGGPFPLSLHTHEHTRTRTTPVAMAGLSHKSDYQEWRRS